MTEKVAEISIKGSFASLEPIEKGWSEDKKFCAVNREGERFLLRISPIERYDKRKALFKMLREVEKLDIPMCRPMGFGLCEGGVYMLHTWIEGAEAEDIIPGLGQGEQYAHGLCAGKILKEIHSIPAPADQENWQRRFGRKMDGKIEMYESCPLKLEGAPLFVEYIQENRRLLAGRPQSF